ncbi:MULTISPECIES: acyltransferase [unclassified Nocardioides]|uniref:acyltransferase family protein n=1 Tax=unclassified Nocardioides TaxID=2615069 RepID=UPI002664F546|nr:acyltransferase [Nocardioides sp. Arc9.136]WKN47644.1 acyltransferase [Nocardioides sp. Arc9.136]
MRGRVDGIDLLRGVAVGLVLLRHAAPDPFPGAGVVGVVVFFALSGHLITGLLVDEVARTGRIDLLRFYRRRARRLVPPLLVLVAGVVVVTLALDPIGDRDRLGDTVLVALTWTADLPLGDPSDATFHLWTLALEEQFYLVWPALLLLAVPRGRTRTLLVVATVGCLLACAATVVWLRSDPDLAYALPTSWAVCFVVGAASRIGADRLRVPRPVVLAALGALAVLAVVPLRGHALTYLAGGPAIALLTAVVLSSWRTWTTVGSPLLRPLVWLGTVSYAAYLWNYPLTVWLRPHTDLAGPLAAVLTLVCAALSWRFVEAPLQRRRAAAPDRAPVAA